MILLWVMKLDNYKKYAPALVRWGVGIVFFLFGISQIKDPANWIAWLPSFTTNMAISQSTMIVFTGVFNLIVGALLILGILTRLAAALAALHLLGIRVTSGYNEITIRDFGLLLGAFAILLNGKDNFCLGKNSKK